MDGRWSCHDTGIHDRYLRQAGNPLSSFAENGEAWILVPGVAFDEKGMRLGYGGGFYDRYLKQKENLHRTGIAFGEQIVKRIPTEIHDHPMDDVITEQQWYRPKRTTGGE